ncbi:ATP-grasp domain-containing protein [Kribbella orskensis]|uniref:ATP-grasp domain-containing protein n=1 Tax=Kribbella orskensis TaxID=2512216 RepID=A0ABY2BS18_9ACTN|nr:MULTISPECIES: ATP-grasp domain-containing protein [Kribbella]TCN43073.1 ATP-grasp domain-containing protein [Kribbella sp. VKM Ac-2500]TCO29571.1 ATP-grasp domain-containing protein [Kribbella orskensis]
MNPASNSDTERPHLLVVATGMRLFREYILRSIAPKYRIHMFLHAEPTWEKEYIEGWTVLETTLDADLLVASAKKLNDEQPIDGVLCWDEARILQTAHVAEALGLPGGDVAMINRCRDKHLTRTALAALGVPQPESVLVDTVDEALVTADKLGYPVILKPRALAASLGVVKVNSPEELKHNWAFAHDTTVPEAPHYDVKVLVEEFADGYEISIDSAVFQGQVTPFCLARKEIGYPPYAEEIGHYVDAADPLLADEQLMQVLVNAHAAIAFTDGVTHTEIMLTADGPKVIEINARIGGDMIPYLGLQATGADPGLAAAAVACGRSPELVPDRAMVGGVRFFYVDENDTVLESVEFGQTDLPATIDQLTVLMEAGQTTSPPPEGTLWGRIAYATAVATSVDDCRAGLDAAEKALRWSGKVKEPEETTP